MLIVVCGLPGTGKSTVANILSKKIKAQILRTDEIRKKLIKKPTYSKKEKELVYKAMLVIADYLAKQKVPCILDATFSNEESRREIISIAKKNKVPFYLVECVCREDVIKERIKGEKRYFSDADWKVYLKIKKEFEPIKQKHIIIDTTKSSREAAKLLIKKLKLFQHS